MAITTKTSNRGLALLGAAAIVFAAGGMAETSGTTSTSTGTTSLGCIPIFLADGFCDEQNNNAECGYDSGDCCSCTCQSTEFICGEDSRFLCIDPAAPCVDDDDITVDQFVNCGFGAGVGDGFCDTDNNNELCDYDGGDCCSCTCFVEGDYTDDFRCSGNFQCIDPTAPCVDDDDITVDQIENCGFIEGVGNAFCDPENNNALCGYDGGDCCECTCSPRMSNDDDGYGGGFFGCEGNFLCIDPEATCVEDDDITVEQVENCQFVLGIGNGICDEENNTAECNYDGGDCCECTCSAPARTEDDFDTGDYQDCGGGFACIDPAAPCVNDDDITVGIDETCDTVAMSDAFCDVGNNRPECNYDGGDCCQCTCEDIPNQTCGQFSGFSCVDPAAPCVNDDDITVGQFETCFVAGIGNGFCDIENNNEECNFDGGDCCQCTCQNAGFYTGSDYDDDAPCGRFAGFACVDPMAPCVDDDSVTVDMLDICQTRDIGNGFCDPGNNVEECAFDGGDCCSCTCNAEPDTSGCQNAFACVDPSAPCVNDDDITEDMLENCDFILAVGNGFCDEDLNNPECNYDGGDCCSCTCSVPIFYDDTSSGPFSGCSSGFACIDPEAPCVDDDSITIDFLDNCADVTDVGNGFCDFGNNNEECNFDGGDCCECTCVAVFDDDFGCGNNGFGAFDCRDPTAECFDGTTTATTTTTMTDDFTDDAFTGDGGSMSFGFGFFPEEDPEPTPTLDGAVEVTANTEVGVEATAHDPRAGGSDFDVGCGEPRGDGCAAENTLDGVVSDAESRWSCSPMLTDPPAPCQIVYTFAEPQDIVDIQIAFWKGNERTRTVAVFLDGVRTHTHESYMSSIFNTIGVEASGVSTVMIESVDLHPTEWLSLLEVAIFVTP